MARNFDGTNDNLLTADNALPGLDTDLRSFGLWTSRAADPAASQGLFYTAIANGAGNARVQCTANVPTTAGWKVRIGAVFTGNDPSWQGDNDITNTRNHLAITWDKSDNANVPVIYANGATMTVTSLAGAPTGTSTGDDTLKMGESPGGTQDLAANEQHFAIATEIWSAAQVNRAMWWGRPGGGLLVYHPLVTTKLTDEGSGAATLTATGTTVVELPTPVVRPGTAMMGMEIGW